MRHDNWTWGELDPLSYGLLMADPPWQFKLRSKRGEAKAPQAQYECMSLDDIKALPVHELARGDCLLWLWACNPMLPQAFEVMSAWGFRFVTAGAWIKTTAGGKVAFGTGYVLRSAHEPFLIGKIGNPPTANNIRSAFLARAREHSRKPDEAYELAAALAYTAARRADLFSRERREGWESFGWEVEKFKNEFATEECAQ